MSAAAHGARLLGLGYTVDQAPGYWRPTRTKPENVSAFQSIGPLTKCEAELGDMSALGSVNLKSAIAASQVSRQSKREERCRTGRLNDSSASASFVRAT